MKPAKRCVLTLLTLFALTPFIAKADTPPGEQIGIWQDVGEKIDAGWETTVTSVSEAFAWTAEKSRQGWDHTRELTRAAAGWGKTTSAQAWSATKQGSSEAFEWTSRKSKQGWTAIQQGLAGANGWFATDATDTRHRENGI